MNCGKVKELKIDSKTIKPYLIDLLAVFLSSYKYILLDSPENSIMPSDLLMEMPQISRDIQQEI